MSITKKAILKKSKPRFELIEVPGFGPVGVRSCPQLTFSMRWASYVEPTSGQLIPEERAKANVHEIIDQICDEKGEPLFTEEDFAELAKADAEQLAPLIEAIRRFNAPDQKKVTDESKDTSSRSKGTTDSAPQLRSVAS